VLVYARAGELSVERVELGRLAADVAEDLGPSVEAAGATFEIGEPRCSRVRTARPKALASAWRCAAA
jgi:hypothetical protein